MTLVEAVNKTESLSNWIADMDCPTSSTSQFIHLVIHLAWLGLVAQLALMANAVIDTAMAGQLSAIDLSCR